MNQLLLYNTTGTSYIKATSPVVEVTVPEDLIEEGAFKQETLRYQYLLNPDPSRKFIFAKTSEFANHRFRLIEGWFERMVVASNGHSAKDKGLSMGSVENAKDDPCQAYFSQKLIRRCHPWFRELADFCDPRLRAIQTNCIRNLALGNIFSKKGTGIPGLLSTLKTEILRKSDVTLDAYVSESDEQSRSGEEPSTSGLTCTLHPWLTNINALSTGGLEYQNLLNNLPEALVWHGPETFDRATDDERAQFLSCVSGLNHIVPLEACNIRLESDHGILPPVMSSTQEEEKGFFVKRLMSWMGVSDVLSSEKLDELFFNDRVKLDVPECVYGKHYKDGSDVREKYSHLCNISSSTTKLEMWGPWLYYVLAGSMTSRFYSFNKIFTEINHCEVSVAKIWHASTTVPPVGSPEWNDMWTHPEYALPEVSITEEYSSSTECHTLKDRVEVHAQCGSGLFGSDKTVNLVWYATAPGYDVLYAFQDFSSGRELTGKIVPVGSEEYPFEDISFGDLCYGGRFEIPFREALEIGVITCTGVGTPGNIGDSVSLHASTQISVQTLEPSANGSTPRVKVSPEAKVITYPSEFAQKHYIDSLLFGVAIPNVYFKEYGIPDESGGSGAPTEVDPRYTHGLVFHPEEPFNVQDEYQQEYSQWVRDTIERLVDPGESSSGSVEKITELYIGEARRLLDGFKDRESRIAWSKSRIEGVQASASVGLQWDGAPLSVTFTFTGPIPVDIFTSGNHSGFMEYANFLASGSPGTEGVFDSLQITSDPPEFQVEGVGVSLQVFPPDAVSLPFPSFSAGFDIGKYFGATEFSGFRFAPPEEWTAVVAEQCKSTT